MSISTFDLFKIGIGPSSSHTVGPMVAAKQFVEQLLEQKKLNSSQRICVELFGSLGATGKGHGTLKAIALGLEGESPENVPLDTINARIEAMTSNHWIKLSGTHRIHFDDKKDIVFHRGESLPYHPNGMRFRVFDREDQCLLEKYYYSIGGGFVVDETRAKEGAVIVADNHLLPYPFASAKELLSLCQSHQLSIAEIMLLNEAVWREEAQTLSQLDSLWAVMQVCVKTGCAQEGILPGGLRVERRAKKLHQQLLQKKTASLAVSKIKNSDPLDVLDWVSLYALAVNEENASGGRVVTAPTNGAAGIIPAVLHYYINFIDGANKKGVHDFLLTAAAVGILFKKNASISGAEVGCQGEVGSACSMAAAGLTAVLGGSVGQIENAAEIAMEHHLGLTCDPIGGLVQIPCIERNAVASVKAIHASRMALSGDGTHFVSLDKVIKTMRETGKDMLDKYKETSRGGLAAHVVEVPVNIIEC
ncbi:MAG: L-serine dehydratase [Candidatus Endobugula sp.]|jgi:L-serine dehydratase